MAVIKSGLVIMASSLNWMQYFKCPRDGNALCEVKEIPQRLFWNGQRGREITVLFFSFDAAWKGARSGKEDARTTSIFPTELRLKFYRYNLCLRKATWCYMYWCTGKVYYMLFEQNIKKCSRAREMAATVFITLTKERECYVKRIKFDRNSAIIYPPKGHPCWLC